MDNKRPGLRLEQTDFGTSCDMLDKMARSALECGDGDRKLVHDAPQASYELFNIRYDPYETKNLAAEQPERFRQMIRTLMIHMDIAQRVSWSRPEGTGGS